MPILPQLGMLPLSDGPRVSASVVAEGIPPILSKLIERWEFINLASVLSSDQPSDDVMAMAHCGQLLLVASDQQPSTISDVYSWHNLCSSWQTRHPRKKQLAFLPTWLQLVL